MFNCEPRLVLRRILVLLAMVSLMGFEPGDVVKDHCMVFLKDKKADCSGFRAEGAGKAKNVILIIGDGMGIGQTYAGRVFVNGPDQPFTWEQLPHHGLVTTCSLSGITDSAASGTAFATGNKTTNGTISMDPKAQEKYQSILERVKPYKATGLVTTTNLWDATPAVFAAHEGKRSDAFEIAAQMVEVTGVDVLLGGGADEFKGDAKHPDLIEKSRGLGYSVVRTRDDLLAVNPQSVHRLFGLFSGGSLKFEADRKPDTTQPHLTDMATTALQVLDQDPRGFFLMIEGARIDHSCHRTDENLLVHEMAEFNRAVEAVLAWAQDRPDTLVLITADHETGGIEITMKPDYHQGDLVDLKWTTSVFPGYAGHSSQRVPIYGRGPNAGAIKDEMDNTEIYCVMKNAFPPPPAP